MTGITELIDLCASFNLDRNTIMYMRQLVIPKLSHERKYLTKILWNHRKIMGRNPDDPFARDFLAHIKQLKNAILTARTRIENNKTPRTI